MVQIRETGDRSRGQTVPTRAEKAETIIGPRGIIQMAAAYVEDVLGSLSRYENLGQGSMRALRNAALEIRGLPAIQTHTEIFDLLLNNLDATDDAQTKDKIASQAVGIAVGFLDRLNSPIYRHPILHDSRVTIPDLHGSRILDLVEQAGKLKLVKRDQIGTVDRALDQVLSRAPSVLRAALTRNELLGLDHEGYAKFKNMADYRMTFDLIRAEYDHPTTPQVARVLERSFGAATVYFPIASFDQKNNPLLDAVNLGNLARSDHPINQWLDRLRRDMGMDEFILAVKPFSGHGSKADRYELLVFYRNRLSRLFEQSSTIVTVNPPWIPDEPDHHGFSSIHPNVRFWDLRRR